MQVLTVLSFVLILLMLLALPALLVAGLHNPIYLIAFAGILAGLILIAVLHLAEKK